MLINNTKKYIINLKRREDRKLNCIKEMEYIGWTNYEFFEAIDTNSYEGCGLSHMAIAKKLLDSNEDYIIVLEDDILFMPWAKKLINNLDCYLKNIEFDVINFSPSIHRPLSKFNDNLVKLHDCPPKDITKHRGIFGTTGFIYNKKVAEMIIKWNTNDIIENQCKHKAIDEFFDIAIYPNTKSYCPVYPILTQSNDFSDINKTFDNNLYLNLYQWNSLITPLPFKNFDKEYIIKQRELGNQIIEI